MKKQHWLVRQEATFSDGERRFYSYYLVCVGKKPKRTNRKRWPRQRSQQWYQFTEKRLGAVLSLDFHLEPGGGPVLLGEW